MTVTVKDVVGLLKSAKTIVLGYGGNAVDFNKDDPLVLDAYGKYLVSEIRCEGDGYYEVDVAMRPVQVGE